MKTFFKPQSFEKSAQALQFKTTSKDGTATENPGIVAKKKKKKNKKPKVNKNELNESIKEAKKSKPQTDTIQKLKKEKSKKKKNKLQANPTIEEPQQPVESPKALKNEKSKTNIANGRVEKKKKKNKQKAIPTTIEAAKTLALPKNDSELNSLADQLKQRLMGGRFRYINEQLYTMSSEEAEKLFQAEPDAFAAYHDGYRHQVEKWPINPLKRIIKMIRRMPKTHEIGDFGCGEGQLAKSVPNKVFSLDLVAARPDIIACDMAHTPLKTASLDVAVYCLSLMGTNIEDYVLEANRVLKIGGLLLIVEIQSRFDGDTRPFLRTLHAAGFELVKREEMTKVFYLFQLKKKSNIGKVARLPTVELKPCVYKKR